MRTQKVEVPPHLNELVQKTPSGTAKLVAAWDGLAAETQILLLYAREQDQQAPGPDYGYEDVLAKALTSTNAFVRYLAARRQRYAGGTEDERMALLRRVKSDGDPLVRYAPQESGRFSIDIDMEDPELFFALPQEARLAKVRTLASRGAEVAALVAYAADQFLADGSVSESELSEILADYVIKPEFKEAYAKDPLNYDGFGEFVKSKDIEELWHLVPKVSEYVAYVLIKHLPESAGFGAGIPKDVLNDLSNRQLSSLLYRKDVGLEELRRRIFFQYVEPDDSERNDDAEEVRFAAVWCNFDISNGKFAALLSEPDKLRIRALNDLAHARDLRLCVLEAIQDALFASDGGPLGNAWEDAEWPARTFEHNINSLNGWQRSRQLLELKLYRLAKQAVPWKQEEKGYAPSNELAFLKSAVVEGDTWATFCAFSKEWENAYHGHSKKLEKYLPIISEAEDEVQDYLPLDEEDIDDSTLLAERVASRLSGLLVASSDPSDPGESKFSELLGKLSVHITLAQETVNDSIASIKTQLETLHQAQSRQHTYTLIAIGVFGALFFIS